MTPSATAFESPSRIGGTELRRLPAGDRDLIERANVGLEALQGKWKLHLIVTMARGIRRHSRLLDCLPGASKKVMTDCLRSLERDGLVRREIYAEVPVRVEYTLTPLGWSMTEAIMALGDWGESHADEVASARQHFWMRDTASDRPRALAAV
jgi:DNA-binding HxlR family transcriptional regulator